MEIEKVLEKIALSDDLSSLTDEERVLYYNHVCESLGLNPATKPFAFLTFDDGKMKLYALRNATDQLREKHGISVSIVRQERIGDYVYMMTARAKTPDGRIDEAVGVVPLRDEFGNVLSPRQFSNAIMTCETKAKRRVTLSICGVSMLDESEVADIKSAKTVPFEMIAPVEEQPPFINTDENVPPMETEEYPEPPIIDFSQMKERENTNPNEEVPPNGGVTDDKVNSEQHQNKQAPAPKKATEPKWIVGQARVLSLQLEQGKKEGESYHQLVLETNDGQQFTAFAIEKLSQSLKDNPLEQNTKIEFKARKTKKGLLLYNIALAS
jgi:hypothetical protein